MPVKLNTSNHSMLNITVAANEQTLVGEIRYDFSLELPELRAITLLISGAADLRPEFLLLWDSVTCYEKASFSLRELMPSIVNKLQKKGQFEYFKPRLNNDYLILQGLPKYTWTKNWYARNELVKIDKILKKNQVDFVLLKGIAETFLDTEALTARTCRDIDILIKPSQLSLFKSIVKTIGWECQDLTPINLANQDSFLGNAFTFRHPAGIVELDVHFSGATLNWNSNEKFVQLIWIEAQKINSDLLLPSNRCRLLISAWNIFDVENIKSQQVLKYFYDFMRHTKKMHLRDKLKFVRDAESNLQFGKQVLSLLVFNAQISKSWHHYVFFLLLLRVTHPRCLKFRIKVSENIYYWLYHTKNNVTRQTRGSIPWYIMIFRTIVESDTYRTRRDSYVSIIKTKRDHLKSFLLNQYWSTKIFLKTHADKPFWVMFQAAKTVTLFIINIVIASLLFIYFQTLSAVRYLKHFYLSMPQNNENKILLQNNSDSKISRIRTKRTYFITANYFSDVPKNQQDSQE